MIIARTPFRFTLGGGGTDLPSFYEKEGGFVFAMCVDKYLYVMLNPNVIDRKIRLKYSQYESVDHVSQLRHPLAREALRYHAIEQAMEIASMADLPAKTGIGSSGSYLVALLIALHTYKREPINLQKLAEEACTIEIDILNEPVGKQDQYMATFGGIQTIEINKEGYVSVSPVPLSPSSVCDLITNTHVYFTGIERSASEILEEQNSAVKYGNHENHNKVLDNLKYIKELGFRILETIKNENFDDFGKMLDEHWQVKKQISNKISLGFVDRLYEEVKNEYGVLGGKIIGAGGGGFLMLYCPTKHKNLSQFMENMGFPRLHYTVEYQGARVIADISSSYQLVNHGRI